jgi:type III secretion protein L
VGEKKKYFTLIAGPEVMEAPQAKIIPADSFSQLLSGKELLEKIKEDADAYRKQVIVESEHARDQAFQEGFEHGYNEWVEHLAKLEEEIKKVRDELQKLVMPIALTAAKKIVAGELKSTPEQILEIVKSTLKTVAQHKKIVIYVSKQDFDILDKNKNEIKKLFEQLESLSIRERSDVESGGCIIETEYGIINAQLKDRWRTLEAAFEALYDKLRQGPTGETA